MQIGEKTKMRIWDLPVNILCNQHLLGEHRELHAIWTYLTTDKGGSYRKHPETLRWVGKELALAKRHSDEVREMMKRGFAHNSSLPLFVSNGTSSEIQDKLVNTFAEQVQNIKSKHCNCNLKKLNRIL